jgi:trehalose 6-phosphate synthase
VIGLDEASRRALRGQSPIVVANRAPISLKPADPDLGRPERVVKGAGGLVTALGALVQATGASWIAASMGEGDRELCRRGQDGLVPLKSEDGSSFRVGYITPTPAQYNAYYNNIANPLLWFTQHYLWDLASAPQIDDTTIADWRDGYVEVNRQFADRVVAQARAERTRTPLVMLQDYHLYAAPAMIRQALPGAVIQQFVHIPWPSAEYWRVLPAEMRDGIVNGLLGNDIVGFQTRRDVHNFLRTCEDNLGLSVDHGTGTVRIGGRSVAARNYPISIDVDHLRRVAASPAVEETLAGLQQDRPEKVILRIDRTDLSKNIVRGFQAYERMLKKHPELHGQVRFDAQLQLTRQDVGEYRSYLGAILAEVQRINTTVGSPAWRPINLDLKDDMNLAVARFCDYDVLMVNPIHDGMNLVSMEGPICNRRNGVLMLSENAGSHELLRDAAVSVNPFDLDGQARALYDSLTMPQHEKERRAASLRETVVNNDLGRWLNRQMADLTPLLSGRGLD